MSRPSAESSPISRTIRSSRGLVVLCTGLLLAYALFVWHYGSIAPAGADTSGYFNLARLLLAGQLHEAPRVIEGLPMRELPSFVYCPLGYVPDLEHELLIPTYPIGLPAMFALAAQVGGWAVGPQLVLVLHAVAGICLTYGLARQAGVAAPLAWLAAGALAVSPLYLSYAMQAMSDLPALCWSAAALLLASRQSGRSAVACGVALGIAVLLRPTNALLAIPVAIALGFSGKRWFLTALGGLPAAIAFALINRAAYGSMFVTGYGSVHEFFGAQWTVASAKNYARWLPVVLSPLVVLALLAPWHRTVSRRVLWAHGVSVVVIASCYLFYYFTHREWWYLRFLLPAFPSLLVLVALGAEVLATRIDRVMLRRALWVAAALVLAINSNYWWRQLGIREIGGHARKFIELQELVLAHVPSNGVVLTLESSGALFFGTPLAIVRWDSIDDAWPRVHLAAERAGRPVYAVLFDFENHSRFAQKTPGAWRKVSQRGAAILWRLEPQP